MNLEFSTRVHDGQAIVQVGGEIDMFTAPELREQLLEVMAHRRAHLILDLADVGFMDAQGLAVLVLIHRQARSIDGSLRITGASQMIRKELRITGLSRHLAVYPTVAAALSALSPNGHANGHR